MNEVLRLAVEAQANYTGWTEGSRNGKDFLARMTKTGEAIHVLTGDHSGCIVWITGSGCCGTEDSIVYAMLKADEIAKDHGGWADFPFGSF